MKYKYFMIALCFYDILSSTNSKPGSVVMTAVLCTGLDWALDHFNSKNVPPYAAITQGAIGHLIYFLPSAVRVGFNFTNFLW